MPRFVQFWSSQSLVAILQPLPEEECSSQVHKSEKCTKVHKSEKCTKVHKSEKCTKVA